MATVLNVFLEYILTTFGIISLFILLYGAYQYMTSMGDPRQLELAKQRITTSVISFALVTFLFLMLALLEPLLGGLSTEIPREFASGILVAISISVALVTIWVTIRTLYKSQQQRSEALISEIKKHDSEFFEYVKRQLTILENREEDNKMSSDVNRIASKPLTPEARLRLQRDFDEFSESLLLQAKIAARSREHVLEEDVQRAKEVIYNSRTEAKLWQELLILLGGILFGTALQGFVNELSQQPMRPTLIGIYVALGFFGMLIIFFGYVVIYVRRG